MQVTESLDDLNFRILCGMGPSIPDCESTSNQRGYMNNLLDQTNIGSRVTCSYHGLFMLTLSAFN